MATTTAGFLGPRYDGGVVVATGKDFADAMAGAPVSAYARWPVILVGTSTLPTATTDVLGSIGATEAVICGGTGAVSSDVEGQLVAMMGAPDVDREAGINRYATAAAVADYGYTRHHMHYNRVAIATGQDYPDALAGGPYQGLDRAVMLLTPGATLDISAAAALSAHRNEIVEVHYLGGTGAVSTNVRNQIKAILR